LALVTTRRPPRLPAHDPPLEHPGDLRLEPLAPKNEIAIGGLTDFIQPVLVHVRLE